LKEQAGLKVDEKAVSACHFSWFSLREKLFHHYKPSEY